MRVLPLLFVFVFLIAFSQSKKQAVCLNEDGQPVDWWVVVKLPAIEIKPNKQNDDDEEFANSTPTPTPKTDEEKRIEAGNSYLYADATHPRLRTSSHTIIEAGAVRNTIKPIFDADLNHVSFMLYNDQPPESEAYNCGVSKGIFAFTDEGGLWMTHSISKWPRENSYPLPEAAKKNGQTLFCFSFDSEGIESIAKQLLHTKPHVYDFNLVSSHELKYPSVLRLVDEEFHKSPSVTQVEVKSKSGEHKFVHFGKSMKWNGQLYESLVADHFGKSMKWHTTHIARSNRTGRVCPPDSTHKSVDVRSIKTMRGHQWTNIKDDSNWGISFSRSPGAAVVCFGDISRSEAHSKRGGGVICLDNFDLWDSFNSLIESVDSCPTDKKNSEL